MSHAFRSIQRAGEWIHEQYDAYPGLAVCVLVDGIRVRWSLDGDKLRIHDSDALIPVNRTVH